MKLICLNIGNTSGHFGLFENGVLLDKWDVPTAQLGDYCGVESAFEKHESCKAFSFCSVVPSATEAVWKVLKEQFAEVNSYQLTCDNIPGLGFDYPSPEEVGGDRMANAVASQVRSSLPAVVIDMGTATTFDIVTEKGYAGGIITAGLALIADYLHEKTALLPKLDRMDLETSLSWGKSTVDAMKIGCNVGYRGMIRELLTDIVKDLKQEFSKEVSVILTGGNHILFEDDFYQGLKREPDLALYGLEEAYKRVGS